jgi:hypothetical protein
MRTSIHSTALATALLLALGTAANAQAAPFTYHGSLTDSGQAANGRYDMQIALYGSEQSATPLLPAATVFGVEVHDGNFSTELDLGDAAQNGGWIGVAVRAAGSGEFASLSGRERLEPAGTCPAAWLLDGNAGTAAAGSYLGTTDEADIVFRAGGRVAGSFSPFPLGASFTAGPGRATAMRAVSLVFGFADADDSLAAGYSGIVQPGHAGSFVWGDNLQASFATSGAQQFLVKAGGGLGINTNDIGGNDDLVLFPRTNGDGDSDFRFRTRSGIEGLIYVGDADGTMYLSSAGGVRITDPVDIDGAVKTAALDVAGTASKATAGAWKANSDGRIKQDIEPIENAVDTLLRLQPVTFRYTDSYRADHAGVADQRYYNVIAQQFAEVFPDAVTGSGEYLAGAPKTPANEILQVDTYPAQIVTIAAVQELAQQNASLQVTVDRLVARIARLEAARGK